MQVRCIQAFGTCVPGDLVEVPDGAAVSDLYWQVVPDPTPPAAAATPAPDSTQQENSPASSGPGKDGK